VHGSSASSAGLPGGLRSRMRFGQSNAYQCYEGVEQEHPIQRTAGRTAVSARRAPTLPGLSGSVSQGLMVGPGPVVVSHQLPVATCLSGSGA
jgi:hypothetical protein